MSYRVIYTDQFIDDIKRHVAYLREEHVGDHVVTRWYERLFDRIDALDTWPLGHPIDESYSRELGHEVRKVNFGDYLVFYEVKAEQEVVRVIAFYHGAIRH